MPSQKNADYRDYNIRFHGCIGADDLEQRSGQAEYFTPPYSYNADAAATVEQQVRAAAGATLHTQF